MTGVSRSSGALVQQRGWRTAWLAIGVALVAGLAPLAWRVVRRGPGACGRCQPDGASTPARRDVGATDASRRGVHVGRTRSRTPAFWIFAIGTALYGLVASGIGLFNESILAERGFGAERLLPDAGRHRADRAGR